MKTQIILSLAVLGLTGAQLTAYADETVMSTQKSSSPAGDTVKVKHDYANYRGTSGKQWKSTEGPDISKHSATQTSDVTHTDGTVSSRRNHESHTVTSDGESHKVTQDHTAVSPDGTKTEEHSTETKTQNNDSAPKSTDMND